MAKTIEIQVAKATMVSKEVTLPYCTKNETFNYYYKIVSPNKTIKIEAKDNNINVLCFCKADDIEISVDEFDAKLNEVINNIKILNK
jgi:hypothetical protein